MNQDVLRLLRIVKDYKQEAIANVLGISQNTYSRLERNPKDITADQAKKLADFYKVDLEDLLTKTPVIVLGKTQNSKQQSEYIALLKELRDFLRLQSEELLKLLGEKNQQNAQNK